MLCTDVRLGRFFHALRSGSLWHRSTATRSCVFNWQFSFAILCIARIVETVLVFWVQVTFFIRSTPEWTVHTIWFILRGKRKSIWPQYERKFHITWPCITCIHAISHSVRTNTKRTRHTSTLNKNKRLDFWSIKLANFQATVLFHSADLAIEVTIRILTLHKIKASATLFSQHTARACLRIVWQFTAPRVLCNSFSGNQYIGQTRRAVHFSENRGHALRVLNSFSDVFQ